MTTATKTKRISVAAVKTALEVVAAEDPTRRDRRAEDALSPRYIDRGRPNCLVARVLEQLGFSLGVLRDLDRMRETGDWRRNSGGGARIGCSRHPALKRIEPLAIELLSYVQRQQDSGDAWGAIAKQAFKRSRWWGMPWDERHDRRNKPWIFAEDL